MGTERKHWAKEVVQRTKKLDDLVNTRFIQKKINQVSTKIAQASASISDLQIQLGTYWNQRIAGTASTTANTTNRARDSVDHLEKSILRYMDQILKKLKIP
jgi:uncharacterized protein YoxC